jgi:hypothetical protein
VIADVEYVRTEAFVSRRILHMQSAFVRVFLRFYIAFIGVFRSVAVTWR